MTSTTARTTARTSARVAATLGAAALAVSLAACGSSSDGRSAGSMGGMGGMGHGASPSASPSASSPSSSAAGQHDSADVTFAQQMVVHHQGAIAMADLAADRAGDQRVKDLAARIRAAQAPEIDQMTGWLQAWGEPTAAAAASGKGGMSGMGGMHHGDGGSAMGSDMGMMTDEQRGQLSAASGAAFDRLFLQMMVVHHQGAVAMSQQEQASGSSSEAKALAASIVTSQTAEIAEMQQLLADLG